MEKQQKSNQDDVPMIEEYRVESTIVHASKWGRIALIICICACIAVVSSFYGIVRVVDIFTTKYNARTSEWIAAFMEMAKKLGVEDGYENRYTETIQQYPPP